MSFSVVAKLLPSSTTTEPNLSISLKGSHVTLAILAKDVAASSAVRLVVTAIFAIVSVNFVISQIPTQSCHQSSAILDNSSNAIGISSLNHSNSFLKAENSASEAFNVFFTQANADSNAIASSVELDRKFFILLNAHNINHIPKKDVSAAFIWVPIILN